MAQSHTHLGFYSEDLRAMVADMQDVVNRYGCEEDVQPHNRAAYAAEMKRINSNLDACMVLYTPEK